MTAEPVRRVDVTDAFNLPRKPSELLVEVGAAKSKSYAKRLLSQGAVRLYRSRDAAPFTLTSNEPVVIENGTIINVGSRFWRVLTLKRVILEVYDGESS